MSATDIGRPATPGEIADRLDGRANGRLAAGAWRQAPDRLTAALADAVLGTEPPTSRLDPAGRPERLYGHAVVIGVLCVLVGALFLVCLHS